MSDVNALSLLQRELLKTGIHTGTQAFMEYLFLLEKWNKTYNLTAIRDIDAMIIKHLLDSLAIAPFVKGQRLLDVGSGAGLPGIPLAIAHPEWHITLLDSNGKKVRFMQEAVRVLKLSNVEVVQTRVETWRPATGFDTVMSRAFSDLAQMLKWTKHLVASHGQWLAMKARLSEAEQTAIQHPYQVKTWQVPGLDGERCCVIIDNLA